MAPTIATTWSLQIVRGRNVGRIYALRPGENVLGNAPNGDGGIDLADQEGTSPRRMTDRQARVVCSEQGLALDDLESPGGTFVNRQRVLPGKTIGLQPGDVIQLGSVQLKVVGGNGPPAPAAPVVKIGPLPTPFVLATGHACRSWDDFLTVAAQRWAALRDELTSGRLAAFLASVQRPDLAPSPTAPGSADERLDAWLGTLPTTRPSRPELEVHPSTLVVRAAPGGGITRRTFQVTNVGYRLLRSSVRVEPAAASWIVVPTEVARMPIVTIDSSDVPIELHIPESWSDPLVGGVLVESNGGTRRVAVRLERPPAAEAIPEGAVVSGDAAMPRAWLARLPWRRRAVIFTAVAVAQRILVAVGGLLFDGSAASLSLRGAVALNALLGAMLAARVARRSGDWRDLPTTAFAGGMTATLAAALFVAACRATEPPFHIVPALAVVLWAGLGLGAAWFSCVLWPADRGQEVGP